MSVIYSSGWARPGAQCIFCSLPAGLMPGNMFNSVSRNRGLGSSARLVKKLTLLNLLYRGLWQLLVSAVRRPRVP
jgi:hypothetical protein